MIFDIKKKKSRKDLSKLKYVAQKTEIQNKKKCI